MNGYGWTDDLTEAQDVTANVYYIQQALMHELGHATGMHHHPCKGAVMSPRMKLGEPVPVLTDADKDAYKGAAQHSHSHWEIKMLRILVAVACVAILGCGTDEPTTPVAKTVTDEGIEHSVTDVEEEPQVEEPAHEQELVVEANYGTGEPEQEMVVEATGLFDLHFGSAVASLEERVYLADVIVRATLVSAANDVLTFTAVEYLKGRGPTRFTVSAATANRNTKWDDNEAILFLSTSSVSEDVATGQSSTTFEFADTTVFDYFPDEPNAHSATSYTGGLADGFTIDSANPVWTPAETAAGVSGAGGNSGSTEYIAASESTTGGTLPTFTLEELKEHIDWVTGGEGIDGYDECVRFGLRDIRYWRDWEEYHGEPLADEGSALQAESGMKDVDILETTHVDIRGPYAKLWLEGRDAEYFTYYVVDDDAEPTNGYSYEIAAGRPLPAGQYRIWPAIQHGFFQACNYLTSLRQYFYDVIVTAPEETVFEAFFDPNTMGYGSGGGVLDPASFTVEGANVTINSLEYENDEIVLTLSPFKTLAGYVLYILDGLGNDVVLAGVDAKVDAAKGTLAWAVDEAPWADGDELMVRVRTAPP